MKNLSTLLIALFLISGCSSNGGSTSSGSGLGTQTTTSNFLITSSLSPSNGTDDSFSVDVQQSVCTVDAMTGEVTLEPGITTKVGTYTVTIRDNVDVSGLTPVEFFPEGINITRYEVSFTSPNASAPRLQNRVFQATFNLTESVDNSVVQETGTFSVILLDLDVIQSEFLAQISAASLASGSFIFSYNVKVTAMGAELNGTPFSISAETFLEVGNFNRCP